MTEKNNEIHRVPKNQRITTNILTNVSVAYGDVFYAIRLRAQIYLSKCSKCPLWLSHKQEDAVATGVAYGCVDDALVDSFTDCNNAFTQFVDVADGLLIHAFLN